ncbi:MAG: HIT family protein [Alistipes sp.]
MATLFTRSSTKRSRPTKIAEDDRFYAFRHQSATKGHTLVVLKTEVDYLFDLDDDTSALHDGFRQKGSGPNRTKTDCKRVAIVVGARSSPCAHPSDPYKRRGGRRFQT